MKPIVTAAVAGLFAVSAFAQTPAAPAKKEEAKPAAAKAEPAKKEEAKPAAAKAEPAKKDEKKAEPAKK